MKQKQKVRNYTFQITLCDECLKKLEKHFKNITEYIIQLKGIPIQPFVREFINSNPEKTNVKYETAKEYFNEYAYSLNPIFFVEKQHKFHIHKQVIKSLVTELAENKEKKPKP